ncbi:MAG: metallophosphoesterase [Bacteroidetes bacterium]|nr:metallophosphoesterase [Bacteroidota bacterium]
MLKKLLLSLIFVFTFSKLNSQTYQWNLLPNSPVPDSASQRFEDISFVNPGTGYIAMYSGIVYKTTNAGNSWANVLTASDFPFAKFRSLGFFNSQFGLLGTLNPSKPLYRTTNGGLNWSVVGNIPNPVPYGICGISVVDSNIAYAVGRYAAPANVIKTTDKGATWTSIVMDQNLVRTLVDCYFWSADSGIVVGGYNNSSYSNGYAVVLITYNGGATWQRVFISNRAGEWCWKISFVSRQTGFVSIERHTGFSYFLKTTNGGLNWTEKPFREYDQEGIGFVNENTGWIGGWSGPTYETTNGGNNWYQVSWGTYVNRFRFVNDTLAYAVGDRVYKYSPEVIPVVQAKFAVIGDYGKAGSAELAVSELVKSRNPGFILTLGNNNYESGEQITIDNNIGQYYSDYIFPYTGNYGAGDSVNRFFPSLGNVDYLTSGAAPYLNYFSLPGNERYYDFIKGNFHFFVINSNSNEPDGKDSSSVQAQWLKSKLSLSSEKWNIVYFNNPPYTSGNVSGPDSVMRWPFYSWGANVVMSGHEHVYERIFLNGMNYFVNGLGGKNTGSFGTAVSGSQKQYNGNYGALFAFEFNDSLVFQFINVSGNLIDKYRITPKPKVLTLKYLIQGMYNDVTNLTPGNSVNVYLRNIYPPYSIVDSAKGTLNQNGTGTFVFTKAGNNVDYYIDVTHKNSLETWSAAGQRFTVDAMNYDFTISQNRAFGNNLVLKGTKFCAYSGDVNQDGVIDVADLSITDNEINTFTPGGGLFSADVNGDFTVDASDLSIVDNNAVNSISKIVP